MFIPIIVKQGVSENNTVLIASGVSCGNACGFSCQCGGSAWVVYNYQHANKSMF